MLQERKCSVCEQTLPIESFAIRSDTGRPYRQCRACRAEKHVQYYLSNTKRHAQTVKRRYDTFGRFRRYGLTVDQYDAALVAQGGKCALCGAQKPGGKGKWHIDHRHAHNHRRGFNQCDAGDFSAFRGLLCHRCNVALGHYEKLIDRVGLARLGEYLNAPNAPQPPSPS